MGGCSCKSLCKSRKQKSSAETKTEYGHIYFPTESKKSEGTHTQIHVPTDVSTTDLASEGYLYNRRDPKDSSGPYSRNTQGSPSQDKLSIDTGSPLMKDQKFQYTRNITDIFVNQGDDSGIPYTFKDSPDHRKPEDVVKSNLSEKDSIDLSSDFVEEITSLYSVHDRDKQETGGVDIPSEDRAPKTLTENFTDTLGELIKPNDPTSHTPLVKKSASIPSTEQRSSMFRTPQEECVSNTSERSVVRRPAYDYQMIQKQQSRSTSLPPKPVYGKPPLLPQTPEKMSRKSSITVISTRNNRVHNIAPKVLPNVLGRLDSFSSQISDPYPRSSHDFFSCRSTETLMSAVPTGRASSLASVLKTNDLQSTRLQKSFVSTPLLNSAAFLSCRSTKSTDRNFSSLTNSPLPRLPASSVVDKEPHRVSPVSSYRLPPRAEKGPSIDHIPQKRVKPAHKRVQDQKDTRGVADKRAAYTDPNIHSIPLDTLKPVSEMSNNRRRRLPSTKIARASQHTESTRSRSGIRTQPSLPSSTHSLCFQEAPKSSTFHSFRSVLAKGARKGKGLPTDEDKPVHEETSLDEPAASENIGSNTDAPQVTKQTSLITVAQKTPSSATHTQCFIRVLEKETPTPKHRDSLMLNFTTPTIIDVEVQQMPSKYTRESVVSLGFDKTSSLNNLPQSNVLSKPMSKRFRTSPLSQASMASRETSITTENSKVPPFLSSDKRDRTASLSDPASSIHSLSPVSPSREDELNNEKALFDSTHFVSYAPANLNSKRSDSEINLISTPY